MISSKELQLNQQHICLYSSEAKYNYMAYLVLACYYMLILLPWNAIFNGNFLMIYSISMMVYYSITYRLKSLLTVIEGGKTIWIFEKYRFAPTSAKRMYHAKLFQLVKFCSKHIILSFLIQAILALVYYQRFAIDHFLPSFLFIAISCFKALQIIFHAHKAFRRV